MADTPDISGVSAADLAALQNPQASANVPPADKSAILGAAQPTSPASLNTPAAQANQQRAALQALQATYAPEYSGLQKRLQQSQQQEQQQIASLPSVQQPEMKFDFKPKEMSDFAGLLMVIGALGGRHTLTPMTAALNNLSGVIKGHAEGNQQAFDQAKEQFKQNFDAGMQKYKEYIEAKKDIYTRNQGDRKEIEQELRELNLRYGMDARVAGLQQTAWKDASKAENDEKERIRKASEFAQKFAADTSGVASLTPEAQDFSAAMTLAGGDGFKPSGRKDTVALQTANFNRMVQIAKQQGITAQDLVANKAKRAALASALTAQTKISVGQEKVGDKLQLDAANLEKMIDSGDAGYMRLLNIPINKAREYMSDPTLAPFALQAELVATEFQRLMIGNGLSVAMLPVAAQESAQRLISRDMSPAELRAMFPVMMRDLSNTIEANKKVQGDIIGQLGSLGGTASGHPADIPADIKDLLNKHK